MKQNTQESLACKTRLGENIARPFSTDAFDTKNEEEAEATT